MCFGSVFHKVSFYQSDSEDLYVISVCWNSQIKVKPSACFFCVPLGLTTRSKWSGSTILDSQTLDWNDDTCCSRRCSVSSLHSRKDDEKAGQVLFVAAQCSRMSVLQMFLWCWRRLYKLALPSTFIRWRVSPHFCSSCLSFSFNVRDWKSTSAWVLFYTSARVRADLSFGLSHEQCRHCEQWRRSSSSGGSVGSSGCHTGPHGSYYWQEGRFNSFHQTVLPVSPFASPVAQLYLRRPLHDSDQMLHTSSFWTWYLILCKTFVG